MTTTRTRQPAVTCTPWCAEGGGHPDEYHDDQYCYSPYRQLQLSRRPVEECVNGTQMPDIMDVLLRRHRDDETTVVINHEADGSEVELTLNEARALAGMLTGLIAKADAS